MLVNIMISLPFQFHTGDRGASVMEKDFPDVCNCYCAISLKTPRGVHLEGNKVPCTPVAHSLFGKEHFLVIYFQA